MFSNLYFLIPTFFIKWIETTREKIGKNTTDVEILHKTFDRMK